MDDGMVQKIKLCIDMHDMVSDSEGVEFYTSIYARIRKLENDLASMQAGWLRAIDEEMVVSHLGVANADDSYEAAKEKLNNLIGFHVDVATDPKVNGGFKLVPVEPTSEMLDAGEATFISTYTGTPTSSPGEVWAAMIAAIPEIKP
jgi:hypothetical protein